MADDDANVVSFRPRSESPSVPLPPLPPTPQPRTPVFAGVGASEGEVGERSAPAGVWPSLPTVADMSPPTTTLAMPGLPKPGKGDDGGAGEDGGDFVPPAPKDPENPTVKDMLAVCMALVTAIGVAAGGGLWARFRHRQALADEARARADRVDQKAGRGAKGADGSKGSSLLSQRGSRTKGGGKNRPPKGPRSDSHNGPGGGKGGGKAPKADKGGKTKWGRDKPKHRRKDRGKDPFKLRKRRPGADRDRKSPKKPDAKAPKGVDKSTPKTQTKPGRKLRWKPSKRRGKGSKDPKGWTSGRPGGSRKRKADKKRRRPRHDRLSWKAPKRKSGGGKAIAGRKRWKRTPPLAPKRRKAKQWRRKRFVRPRVHRRWKRTRAWATNWRLRRRAQAGTASTGSHRRTGTHRAGTGGTWAPPPGFEGMRPPPWADRRPWYHVERIDDPPRERWDKPAGRPELPPPPPPDPETPQPEPAPPAAPEPAGPQPPTKADDDVKTGVPYVSVPAPRVAGTAIPVHGAQFRDAELTIRDVLEAGEEMAEEILAGVDTAQRSAAMCETLAARLETLHAELCELEVPGILIPNVAILLDKAEDVRGKALAIAEGLPLASEAMRVASANAAVRHQPTADMTRDMGHIKPAERPYHEEQ